METAVSGALIALEGIDGSGKGTQAALLLERLKRSGVRAELLSFPRYRQTSFGAQIGRFLNGEFGRLDEVHPLLAALLFAGDRFESRPLLLDALSHHDVVLCDRYVASNIAHQAAERKGDERRDLIEWIERLEHGIYSLPQARLTIWLDVSVPIARELIASKGRRSYTDQAADLHEADADYLQQVHDVYAELARTRPDWTRVECLAGGKLRAVEDIAEEIHHVVRGALPCGGRLAGTTKSPP
jgi:dTMP kinase